MSDTGTTCCNFVAGALGASLLSIGVRKIVMHIEGQSEKGFVPTIIVSSAAIVGMCCAASYVCRKARVHTRQ